MWIYVFVCKHTRGGQGSMLHDFSIALHFILTRCLSFNLGLIICPCWLSDEDSRSSWLRVPCATVPSFYMSWGPDSALMLSTAEANPRPINNTAYTLETDLPICPTLPWLAL